MTIYDLKTVEQSFGLEGFPGLATKQIPARALIKQLIVWWRTLEPANYMQQNAYGRLPGTIRLIDTFSYLVGGAYWAGIGELTKGG